MGDKLQHVLLSSSDMQSLQRVMRFAVTGATPRTLVVAHKDHSTRCSNMVSYRSTDHAIGALLLQIERDAVHSQVYGRSCNI